ncbi:MULTISPECIES: hypothetical protein [Prevotellaceae]|uniref:hypothetical protein n=1 Tax=Prevotellaceae TaxID=171552 RepID=UPI0003FD38AF|nr:MULTISPECIES: hypothetical protein [Prevotellaceae]KGF41988.1 hypothetical protein HMPREF2140_02560 [Hoylesella buccalis DNF00985]
MIRETFSDKYNEEVRIVIRELFNICKQTMKHPGDLLVCQQNGFIGLGAPSLGIGITGLNYMQQLNQIVYPGIGKTTNNNECFVNSRSIFFNGTTDFEQSIEEEMHRYHLIWENGYFLKTLKEISHLLNGENYDWELDIDSKTRATRSNYIKDAIITKFSKAPKFQNLLEETYNKDLRNAIAHTQYRLIQGGIVLTSIKDNNHQPFYGITFEKWEEIYSKAWFLLRYIFSGLNDIMELYYVPLAKEKISGGIPILIPNGKKWSETYVYYFKRGNRWTFHK